MTVPPHLVRLHLLVMALLTAAPLLPAAPAVGPATSRVDEAAYAHVLYVDSRRGSDPDGDGSRGRPWATVAHALERAGRPATDQRTAILVSQGRYAEPTLLLKPNVDIYGGFEAPGGARDIYAHRTVFDGAHRSRIALGADGAHLDGIEFENGLVRGKGAALFCDGTSPVVSNCFFTGNRTLIPEPWKPIHLHETANDGGAVMVTNGGAPRLEHDLFFHNTTECGRGAAVAVDRQSSPRILGCVLANNSAGFDDPMRSSDGGAIAIFDGSAPEIADNVIVANTALTKNDAGGIWVALWSSARVERNVIVANVGGDDAGGLFLGGQEHRYGVPLDSYPPADKFKVIVADNVLVGNDNGSHNSGAMRITMESRVQLTGNLITENTGGMYLQRSEVDATNNTVWQDWQFLEDKPSLGPSRFTGNVLKGPAGPVEARASFDHNLLPPALARGSNAEVTDIFQNDGVDGSIAGIRFDPVTFTTVVTLGAPLATGTDYVGRSVRLADGPKGGQWRVIRSTEGNTLVLWGALEPTTKPPRVFSILRTFTPKPGTPTGLGAHRVTQR